MDDLIDIKQVGAFNKDEFIHKVNSHLAVISGYLQMLEKQSNNNDELNNLINSANIQCQKLIEYVEQNG